MHQLSKMEKITLSQLKQFYMDQDIDIPNLKLPTVCTICNTGNGSDGIQILDCTHKSPHSHYKCLLNSYTYNKSGWHHKDPHKYCTGTCREYARNAPDTALSKSEYEIFFEMEQELFDIARHTTLPGFNAQQDSPMIDCLIEMRWRSHRTKICTTNTTPVVSFLESYYIFQKTKHTIGLSAIYSQPQLDAMFESGVRQLGDMFDENRKARKLRR